MSGLGTYFLELFQATALLIFGAIFLFFAVSTIRIFVLGARRLFDWIRRLALLNQVGIGVLLALVVTGFIMVPESFFMIAMSLIVPGFLSGIIWGIDLAHSFRFPIRTLSNIWGVIAVGLALDLSLELVRHL